MANYPYDNKFTPNDLYRFADTAIEYSVDINYGDIDYEDIGIVDTDSHGVKTYNMYVEPNLSTLLSDLSLIEQAYAEKLAEYQSASTSGSTACACRCADFPNCVRECDKQSGTQQEIGLELSNLDDVRKNMYSAIGNFEYASRSYVYDIHGYNSYRTTVIDNEQICRAFELP